jgi:hypothetical protein
MCTSSTVRITSAHAIQVLLLNYVSNYVRAGAAATAASNDQHKAVRADTVGALQHVKQCPYVQASW